MLMNIYLYALEDEDELKEYFEKKRKESTAILKESLSKYQKSLSIPGLGKTTYFAHFYNFIAGFFGWETLFIEAKVKETLKFMFGDEEMIKLLKEFND